MSEKYTERINCYLSKKQMETLRAISAKEGSKISAMIRKFLIESMREYLKK